MEVKIKFDIGDKIWFMYNNKPNISEVQRINITKTKFVTEVYIIPYNLNNILASKCFKTKQELLNSL